MRKVVIHSAGSHSKLRLEEHPIPEPAEGQVLVEVRAIGINYADCIVRMGLYESAKKYVGWPITPGFEVAGVISGVGPGVDAARVGEEVIAVTRFGGYTTHLVVDQDYVVARPDELSMEQAAAFPSVALTAWFALFELAHPRPGWTMLVHSAAGGVGSVLVQLGRVAGCRVVGVVGASHKVAAVEALGADVVIDKSSQDLWTAAEQASPDGYQVICDANGVATLGDSYAHLAPPGKLVVYGFHTMMPRKGGRPNWLKLARDWVRTPRFNPLEMTGSNRSVLAFNLSYLFDNKWFFEEAMAQLLGFLADGALLPPTVTTYPLDRVADAHRDLESAQTVGKLVLIP